MTPTVTPPVTAPVTAPPMVSGVTPIAGAFGTNPARARLARVACLMLAVLGWANLANLARIMLAQNPPAAGFDLEVLLDAARRVAGGGSPYDPNAVAGGLQAHDLFYSYPPLVAQVLAPISGLPTWLVLSGWWIGAVVGLVAIAALLPRSPIGRARVPTPGLALDTVLLGLAAAPYFFPFIVALLFGNVDAWFPLLFGALVLTLAGGRSVWSGPGSALGGAALAAASAVKLHPGTLLLWLVARPAGPGASRRRLLRVAGATVAFGVAILALSLLLGGPGPWREYVDYLRLGSDADLASRVNIGPASQIALLVGDPGLARPLAAVWAGLAVVATVVVARTVRDPLESATWAIVASLVVLPVTWYHYPVALIPAALAAWTRSRGTLRARRVTGSIVAAYLVADAAIALPVATWLAVALLLVAVRWSSPSADPVSSGQEYEEVAGA